MSVDSSVRFSLLSTDGVENNEARFSLGARYRHFSPTGMYVCHNVCMYVIMYVCRPMYVCMYVCIYMYVCTL